MVTVVLKGTSFRASIMMYYSIKWRAHCAGISTANVAICVFQDRLLVTTRRLQKLGSPAKRVRYSCCDLLCKRLAVSLLNDAKNRALVRIT
jgi:hypothetical protein